MYHDVLYTHNLELGTSRTSFPLYCVLEECELQHAAEFRATLGIKMDQVQQILGAIHPKIGTSHDHEA